LPDIPVSFNINNCCPSGCVCYITSKSVYKLLPPAKKDCWAYVFTSVLPVCLSVITQKVYHRI